jgi:hypothetical protein
MNRTFYKHFLTLSYSENSFGVEEDSLYSHKEVMFGIRRESFTFNVTNFMHIPSSSSSHHFPELQT